MKFHFPLHLETIRLLTKLQKLTFAFILSRYVDPFFLSSGKAHYKNDIYSLGLIILQLCSNVEDVGSLHHILGPEKSDSERMLGKLLKNLVQFDDSFPERLCLQIVIAGIECVKRDPAKRPSLEEVHNLVCEIQVLRFTS